MNYTFKEYLHFYNKKLEERNKVIEELTKARKTGKSIVIILDKLDIVNREVENLEKEKIKILTKLW